MASKIEPRREAVLLLKMCVSCKRELDFQGLGAPKNLSKGVGIPMQYWDAFWHHFFHDFWWSLGGFGELLGSKSQILGSKSDVKKCMDFMMKTVRSLVMPCGRPGVDLNVSNCAPPAL